VALPVPLHEECPSRDDRPTARRRPATRPERAGGPVGGTGDDETDDEGDRALDDGGVARAAVGGSAVTAAPATVTVSLRVAAFRDGDVLLVRDADSHEWELPGGRLEVGEDPNEGLHREAREETGLDVTVSGPVHTAAWQNRRGKGRFAVYYHATVPTREVTLSDEHSAHEWVAPGGAGSRLDGPQRRAVERATEVEGL
jgi:ADP-ribose pyrophosphatase YjhB (NUDIX family)